MHLLDNNRLIEIDNLELNRTMRVVVAQFRYIKIQPKTIDITTRLWGINPTNSVVYFPEPRTEVYCFRLNFNISKLGYSKQQRLTITTLYTLPQFLLSAIEVHH